MQSVLGHFSECCNCCRNLVQRLLVKKDIDHFDEKMDYFTTLPFKQVCHELFIIPVYIDLSILIVIAMSMEACFAPALCLLWFHWFCHCTICNPIGVGRKVGAKRPCAVLSAPKKFLADDSTFMQITKQSLLQEYIIFPPCSHLSQFTVVSQKYTPPFATLALVQNAGRLIHGMQQFLSRLRPPCMTLIVGGGGTKCEALPSAKQRDALNTSSRLTSFRVEARGSRVFP